MLGCLVRPPCSTCSPACHPASWWMWLVLCARWGPGSCLLAQKTCATSACGLHKPTPAAAVSGCRVVSVSLTFSPNSSLRPTQHAPLPYHAPQPYYGQPYAPAAPYPAYPYAQQPYSQQPYPSYGYPCAQAAPSAPYYQPPAAAGYGYPPYSQPQAHATYPYSAPSAPPAAPLGPPPPGYPVVRSSTVGA